MAKGFGIAALVIAIVGIFVPVVSIFVVWFALVLAAVAGLFGNKAYPIAAIATCLVNLIFLSPVTWAALIGEEIGGGSTLRVITILLFIAPIATMVLGAMFGAGKREAA